MEQSVKKAKMEIQKEKSKDVTPSTSGLNKAGGPISLLSEDEDSNESEDDSEN